MYWLACNINRTSTMLSTNSIALTCGKVPTLPSNKDSSGYLSGQIKTQFKWQGIFFVHIKKTKTNKMGWFLTPLKTVLVSGQSSATFQPKKGFSVSQAKKNAYFSLWATPCCGEAPPTNTWQLKERPTKCLGEPLTLSP